VGSVLIAFAGDVAGLRVGDEREEDVPCCLNGSGERTGIDGINSVLDLRWEILGLSVPALLDAFWRQVWISDIIIADVMVALAMADTVDDRWHGRLDLML
jgi:hypothetical protein